MSSARVGFEQASIGQIAAPGRHLARELLLPLPMQGSGAARPAVADGDRDGRADARRADLRDFLTELVDALIADAGSFAGDDLMRDMLSVYIRRPAGLDLADQPFPLVMEVARRFAAARERELRPGSSRRSPPHLFLDELFGAVGQLAGPARRAARRAAAARCTVPRRPAAARRRPPSPAEDPHGTLRPLPRPPRLARAARGRDRHRWIGLGIGKLRTEFNLEASLPQNHPFVQIDRRSARSSAAATRSSR